MVNGAGNGLEKRRRGVLNCPLPWGQRHADFVRGAHDALTDTTNTCGGGGEAVLGPADRGHGFIQGDEVRLVGHSDQPFEGLVRGSERITQFVFLGHCVRPLGVIRYCLRLR